MKEKIIKLFLFLIFFILLIQFIFVYSSAYTRLVKNEQLKEQNFNYQTYLKNHFNFQNDSFIQREDFIKMIKKDTLVKPIDYLEVFKIIDIKFKNNYCQKNKCIFDNSKNNFWLSNYDKDKFIKIKRFLKIKVSLKNIGDLSGISLNNSFSDEGGRWHQNNVAIFFGFRKNGEEFYIDTRKRTEEPIIILDDFYIDKNFFYIYTDSKGRYFFVVDINDDIIYEFDINKKTGNLFPDGIFPDQKVAISYVVAPFSKLIAEDLLIWNLD